MPTETSLAVKNAQGIDTEDFLSHIAWTDVVKPRLELLQVQLTKKLVDNVLTPTQLGAESREQIAGRLYGINFIINEFEKIVREGRNAGEALAERHIYLKTN